MFNRIFAAFTKTKIQSAETSLIEQLAKFDPNGMSDAGMAVMEQQLNEFCTQTEQARQEYNKELQEYQQIQHLYDTRIAAAENISVQIQQAESAGNVELSSKLNVSLNKLLDTIDQSTADVAREKQEADEALQTLTELEAATKDLAEQMKTARSQFEAAKRDLKSAEAQKARAEIAADRAATINGLKTGGNNLNAALTAIQKNAEQTRVDAEAIKRKTQLLTPTNVETDDQVIVDALKVAQGTPVTESASDRLARLKKVG